MGTGSADGVCGVAEDGVFLSVFMDATDGGFVLFILSW